MAKFFLCALAVWRVTAHLCYEKTFKWLRDLARTYMLDECGQPITFLGKVLSCFWCTSSFVAIPFAFVVPFHPVLAWLALSGAAVLLNHISRIALYAEK